MVDEFKPRGMTNADVAAALREWARKVELFSNAPGYLAEGDWRKAARVLPTLWHFMPDEVCVFEAERAEVSREQRARAQALSEHFSSAEGGEQGRIDQARELLTLAGKDDGSHTTAAVVRALYDAWRVYVETKRKGPNAPAADRCFSEFLLSVASELPAAYTKVRVRLPQEIVGAVELWASANDGRRTKERDARKAAPRGSKDKWNRLDAALKELGILTAKSSASALEKATNRLGERHRDAIKEWRAQGLPYEDWATPPTWKTSTAQPRSGVRSPKTKSKTSHNKVKGAKRRTAT